MPGEASAAGERIVVRRWPQGDVLRAEAVLANDDIGFVQVGQRAKVKLAAYPFQKYGLLEGTVVRLSADAVDPSEAAKATGSAYATPQLAYKAVLELNTQNLALLERRAAEAHAGHGGDDRDPPGEKDGDGVPVESGAAGVERGGEGAVSLRRAASQPARPTLG